MLNLQHVQIVNRVKPQPYVLRLEIGLTLALWIYPEFCGELKNWAFHHVRRGKLLSDGIQIPNFKVRLRLHAKVDHRLRDRRFG